LCYNAPMTDRDKIQQAIAIMTEYAMIDGSHHKQWVIDQVLRALLGSDYEDFIYGYNHDPDYEDWDEGIAP
jgi:hypothetical protein